MRPIRTLIRFLLNYKLFSLAIIGLIISLILTLNHYKLAGEGVLTIVSAYTVIPILWGMWRDLQTGRYGIDILAVTAIVASIVLGQYWAAIVIVIMFTGGEALEDFAEHRAKTELDALLSRAPQEATVIRKNKTLTIPVSEIRVGDDIVLKAGEVVPADATISEGTATFDESSLTGESAPQAKKKGDLLLSGSIDMDGPVTARCIRVASDSQYAQIIALVEAASNSLAPVVRLADLYSVPFTAAAFAIAIGAWLLGHQAIRFLDVIVVATPCPLLLAAPIAIISGMSRAAKQGIIIKTGSALEQLASTKTVAFDKTGTLTEGIMKVDTVNALAPFTKNEVLAYAAGLEQNSNHVVALAIQAAVSKANVKPTKTKQVKEIAGQGLEAMVSGKHILVGRRDFLESHNVEMPAKLAGKQQSGTAVYIGVGGKLAGYITLTDSVRENSKNTVQALAGLGIANILMVTGDNLATAKAVAKQVGIKIKDIHAHMLPAGKLKVVEEIPERERPVAFVGDGVNDAPVLTAANVGIALGARGSTAASESANVVIMLDDIGFVAEVFRIARRTFRIARQSIIGGILLSLVLMFVFATGHFAPLTGAIIQELVDVIVIFNALRAHFS